MTLLSNPYLSATLGEIGGGRCVRKLQFFAGGQYRITGCVKRVSKNLANLGGSVVIPQGKFLNSRL